MSTILDVARVAQVSPSSVSNFFNERLEKMTPATRQRIQDAVTQLGYRPSRVARQLKTGRAPIIGLLVPSVANPFFGEVASAIQRAAQAKGYQLILCNTFRDPGRETEVVQELAAFGVRGAIVGSSLHDPTHLAGLAAKGLAVVSFDGDAAASAGPDLGVISIDNGAALATAVEHLVGLGHRRIAYVTGPVRSAARAARLRGFKAAMRRRGLSRSARVHEIAVLRGGYDEDMIAGLGAKAAFELMQFAPRPTALIAMNDLLAIGLAAFFRERGLRIPNDISLVGIDDLFLARLMNPPMTSVRQPLAAMASAAVERLVNRMEGRTDDARDGIFQPELIVRSSTAPPPGPSGSSA